LAVSSWPIFKITTYKTTMSNAPFSYFYDTFFATAPQKNQAVFLRQLFTKDALLRESFLSFMDVSLAEGNVAVLLAKVDSEILAIQTKVKTYDWEVLYDMDPTADDYSDMVTDLLERDLIGEKHFPTHFSCETGDLLEALFNLRVFERSVDFNWDTLSEPASYYHEEVGQWVGFQFDAFHSSFADYVFSAKLIQLGIELVDGFGVGAGAYFDFSLEWIGIADMLLDRLDEVEF
jgi:hypothetical protein